MKLKQTWLVATVAAITIAGCNQDPTNDAYGSASVAALTSGDVDYVVITAESPPGNIVDEQTIEGDGSGNFPPVQFDELEVGAYTFGARAYEDLDGLPHDPLNDTLLYEGTADATITEGAQAGVIIVLQQVPPADEFDNTVPIFQSLVYTPANPRTDEVITLTATVSDPDVGDVVSLSWTAPGGGSLADANADGAPFDLPSVDWTAPSSEGTYPVTIEATDQSGATATLTANIGVSLRLGSAEVTIDLNTWPEVSNLVPDPTRIDVGESTTLTLTASDENGDDLAYAWSATGCAGIFSDDTAASPSFQLTDAQGNTECTLSVGITDVDTVTALPRGGSNTASVTIATGPEVEANATPPPPPSCPCWDGSPGSAGSSLAEVWSTLSPSNCSTVDRCSERADNTGAEKSEANCVSDLPGNPRLYTFVEFLPGAAPGSEYRCVVQIETGQLASRLDLLEEEYAICRAEHDAFTATTAFATPPLPPPPGLDEDVACGLPTPGSASSGSVACSVTPPGLVLSGTDYAGIGSVNPSVRDQDCADAIGSLYSENGCGIPSESQRISLCNQALGTAACQSCLNTGSPGSCNSCRSEIENRFTPACLGAGLPDCQ